MKKAIVAIGVIMLFSGTVWASGLAIPEQGAAALGMSAAMTARSEDLSAIFYNPAGIDYVEGFELYAGITPIMPRHTYSPMTKDVGIFSKIDAEKNMFLPPQLYAAYRVHPKAVIGLGVYAPFGLGTEWADTWAGRYTSTYAEIQTVNINPTIAIEVHEKLSLGIGVSYITSSATIEKMVNTGGSVGLGTNTAYDSEFGLDGDGTAWGLNLGALLRPMERLQLGVSYRFAYDLEYEGKAKFKHKDVLKNIPGGVHPITGAALSVYDLVSANMPASQTGTATMNMPWMLNFGLLYDFENNWDVSLDLDFVGWKSYEELTIDFEDDKPYDEQTLDKDWENSFILRAGTSYVVNESLVARGGILFDKNPVPDETMDGQLPDANRFGFSLGMGYTFGKVTIDAGYMILLFQDREKDNAVGFDTDTTGDGTVDRFDVPAGYPIGNGNYESRAHLISVAASMAF